MADTNFYRAFEDRYRGSRELIKSRLAVYLPFILPLRKIFDSGCGIDLGCGRGEWLELMQENGMDVHGIDVDQGMLAAAHERGLNVSHGDAIQYLKTRPSESQMLITGFHLAEHLSFDMLQVLVKESLRVLRPGGLLFLETPNPENIVVGATSFYLDPSHQRPIPSQLLSFVVEYSGFERVKTLRLQEEVGLAEDGALSLLNVFNGVSPDYAIAAQKAGNANAYAATTKAFDLDYGLTLEYLAASYDNQIKTSLQRSETIAQHAEAKAQHAEAKAQHAEAKAQHAEVKAAEHEQRAIVSEERIISLLNSTSWKITSPVRMFGLIVKRLLRFPKTIKSAAKRNLKLFLAHTKLYISRRPRLGRVVGILLARFPVLKGRLKQALMSHRVQPSVEPKLANLTPLARRIYADLNVSIGSHDKERD